MAGETERLLRGAGLEQVNSEYFLYLPEGLYRSLTWVETMGRRIPLGGQYATFGQKQAGPAPR